MASRFLPCAAVLSVPFLLGPSAALAQEVAIAHDEIKCIVAGKFPKMGACFTPESAVGKARVYFRPENLSSWFYVDMAKDASCHAGVLPRPSRKLIDKTIYYYLDVQGQGTARTQEYAPVVVEREEDCKNLPAAPAAATGPAAVYPTVPAGFAGAGVSGAVIGAGVAGILITGGGSVLDGGGDDERPTITPPTVPPVTNPPTTPPPTVGPSPTPAPLSPLVVACEAAPRTGEAPLRVQFATFPTGGTGTYEYLWSFGDGNLSPNPNPAHTFLNDGEYDATVRVISGDQVALCTRRITVARIPEPSPSPSPTTTPSPSVFRLQVQVVGGGGNVTGPGIDCPTDCEELFPAGTVVTLTANPTTNPPAVFSQWQGHCVGTAPCVVTMDSNRNVVAHFDRVWTLTVQSGVNSDVGGTVTSTPGGISCTWPPACTSTAPFLNNTTVTLSVITGGVTILWGGACTGAVGASCTLVMDGDKVVTLDTLRLITRGAETRSALTQLQFTSQLEVEAGEGQVVVNGRMSPAKAGLSAIAVERRPGTNRVEAVLVRGARPGVWRFDFSGQAQFRPGSLRVVAGTVATLAGDTAAFRLQGRPGERIVFTFEIDP